MLDESEHHRQLAEDTRRQLQERWTQRPLAPLHIDDAIRAAFNRFDANASGRLDYRELRNALNALGLDVTRRESAEVCPPPQSPAASARPVVSRGAVRRHARRCSLRTTPTAPA